MSQFPQLPIITPGPDRKTASEKYGGLLYLMVGGLVLCFGMLAVFGFGIWSMRSVWADIYLVNDVNREEIDRINAAWRLAHDPRINDRQRWDLALSPIPPTLARYLLAESLTSAASSPNPRAYIHSVSRSTGLPDFLPILMARPLAFAAAGGRDLDREALLELSKNREADVAVWALFSIVVDESASPELTRFIEAGKTSELARMLQTAADVAPPARQRILDEATMWLRRNQPHCNEVWNGWKETAAGIVADSP